MVATYNFGSVYNLWSRTFFICTDTLVSKLYKNGISTMASFKNIRSTKVLPIIECIVVIAIQPTHGRRRPFVCYNYSYDTVTIDNTLVNF